MSFQKQTLERDFDAFYLEILFQDHHDLQLYNVIHISKNKSSYFKPLLWIK